MAEVLAGSNPIRLDARVYREMLLAELSRLHEVERALAASRRQSAALRDELRRYTAAIVAGRTAA